MKHTPRSTARHFLVSGLAVATIGAVVALPTAPASAASYTGNLSNNPTLSRSTAGYSMISGARANRVHIRKHNGARFAIRATMLRTAAKFGEPREIVAPRHRYYFGTDVKGKRGSKARLSVTWYNSHGHIIGSRNGGARSLGGWRRVGVVTTAPASARSARSYVVVVAKARSQVFLTNHVVRRQTTSAGNIGGGYDAQPGAIVYGNTAGVTQYAHPGGLVIAGINNYDDPAMKAVSAGGGTVLMYLDTIVDNDAGRYGNMLLNSSVCGGAVPRWPGNVRANSYGYLNDFRPGSVLQGKLRCVLEKMVAENPHIGGFFADDLGSRSWFPGFDWNSFGSSNQGDYRQGAIAISRTFRNVADAHGLLVMVNGTWEGGAVGSSGGGYPDISQNGNALADGTLAEHHDWGTFWGRTYPCAAQWANQSDTTHGRAVNMAVTMTSAGRGPFARSGCYTHAAAQSDYDSASSVWTSFHSLGLPSRVS